ncbi:MAG: helix-turn-helix domain-containing protein [Oscillospiraceae bacterium]|nr:helix-turn-helix domain-containing protein [Oscillospiraceae bacterium]
MNNTLLGKKIKEARLAKKMTQSDVVGGYITRNMLSQIESGAAFPSIRTLEYLSGVLEVPMSELVSDEFSENQNMTDLQFKALMSLVRDILDRSKDIEEAKEKLDKYVESRFVKQEKNQTNIDNS